MLTCPHCNQRAMSALRKSFLGPAMTVRCKSCGEAIAVSWWALPAVMPMVGGAASMSQASFSATSIALFAAIFLVCLAVYIALVPLVRRGT
jgi:hypothetical protein